MVVGGVIKHFLKGGDSNEKEALFRTNPKFNSKNKTKHTGGWEMKPLKFLLAFLVLVFLARVSLAGTGNYNLLHLIAPDSGEVLLNSAQLDYQDVNLNSKPSKTDTITVTVDARYAFYADTAGYINATSGATGTYNGSDNIINVSPGDTLNFWVWLWNDSNDSTAFKIVSIGGKGSISDNTDSVVWSLAEDSDSSGIYESATDSDLSGTGSITSVVGRAGSGQDTIALVILATVDPTATQNAADSITVTFNTVDAGIDQNPANQSLVFWVSVQAPYMTLAKTVSISDTQPGGRAVFTLTFGNTGNGNAYNVVIEDTIPTYTVPGYGDTIVWIIAGDYGVATSDGSDSVEFYETGTGWCTSPIATSVGSYNVYKSVTKIRFHHSQVNAGDTGLVDTFAVLIPWIE